MANTDRYTELYWLVRSAVCLGWGKDQAGNTRTEHVLPVGRAQAANHFLSNQQQRKKKGSSGVGTITSKYVGRSCYFQTKKYIGIFQGDILHSEMLMNAQNSGQPIYYY